MRPEIRKAEPVWFHVPEIYTLLNRDGSLPIHSFFDLIPQPNLTQKQIDFVTLTPIGSDFGYDIDLVSGKIFRQHNFCPEKDIWERNRTSLHRPPVTFGFIPRLLDQTGVPQKIIVLGRGRYFNEFSKQADFTQTARVVGGSLHQYCDQYPCETRERWLSSLVLIAVNPKDPELAEINNMTQLKKVVNWQDVVAFMENSFGRNLTGANDQPAYRFLGEVPADKALEYALEKGHLFNFEELKTMRRSCHGLYDFFWQSSELVRDQTQKKQSLDNTALEQYEKFERERAQTPEYMFKDTRAIKEKEKEELLSQSPVPKNALTNYALFLDYFIQTYGRQMKACTKFVRHTNLSLDRRRHWYFAQVQAFIQLEELGYVFNCNRQAWVENFRKTDGSRLYDPRRELRLCTPSQLDRAFDTSITMLSGIRNSFRPHYRFIEYDESGGGSHQQVYSWVFDNGKRLSCDRERSYQTPIFPSDITWEPFYDDRFDKMRMIR